MKPILGRDEAASMNNNDGIVIGIDGGGTSTRILVSDLEGQVLSYVNAGPASIHKDLEAKRHVNEGIIQAVQLADRQLGQVHGLAAGIAGYDSPSDLEWVESLTDVEGLTCPKWHFNDAIAAHYGAHMTKPGIIAISGTGSTVAGITEERHFIRNYDFYHYAASAARFIAYDCVYEVLAGQTDESDSGMVNVILQHWGVDSLDSFYKIAQVGFAEDRRERDRVFGELAPVITDAASEGSHLACKVCDHAMDQIKVGIELLASAFSSDNVDVALIGSVLNSAYFQEGMELRLRSGRNKSFEIIQPRFAPVGGAVLHALNQLGIHPDKRITDNLESNRHAR
ncbi:N-acetylglucosamine kinase [Paenibacillus lupini]|uniref:N-acetylglucosamine kinase n=1 Tax=Paenibacillus lupini TaxID=1450204 RepID=UPI001FBA2259|nr:BadF/BadG/BcrA/BcrD ATPase family protein [Paenibacillus lupini]NIK26406.1 glucosamine kinase [Paenibacillus lupini]